MDTFATIYAYAYQNINEIMLVLALICAITALSPFLPFEFVPLFAMINTVVCGTLIIGNTVSPQWLGAIGVDAWSAVMVFFAGFSLFAAPLMLICCLELLAELFRQHAQAQSELMEQAILKAYPDCRVKELHAGNWLVTSISTGKT